MEYILNDIQILLAALKPSQYRKYWRQWKGLDEFNNINMYKEKLEFIERYIVKHKKPFKELNFKKYFESRLNSDNSNFYHHLYNEVYKNIDKYIELSSDNTIKKLFGNGIIDSDSILEDKNLFLKFMKSIINEKIYTESDLYKNELENEKYSFEEQQMANLQYDAEIEFDSTIGKEPIYTKSKKDSSKIYEELFNHKYRIALDINIDVNDIISSSEKNVKTTKYNNTVLTAGMSILISKYYELLNKPNEADAVQSYSLSNTDEFKKNYIEGYYISPVSNIKISIGKIFNLIKKKSPDFKILNNDISILEKIYNNRLVPFKGKIIISRHPYDIAGMSTDRGWTSCMNLDSGEYKNYVETSLNNGALIAYLVNENDTNINKPISRLLIKTFVKIDEDINFNNPNWLLKVSSIYGQNYEKFSKIVQNWLNDNWNDKIKKSVNKYTTFTLHDGFYNESSEIDNDIKIGD